MLSCRASPIRFLVRPVTSHHASSTTLSSSSYRKPKSKTLTMSASSNAGGGFKLSESSVLKINKGDITEWFVDGSSDAIVNPANERMLGGGGADGAIHRAAGPELREACYKVPEVRPGVRCPTGEARITPGFKLPVSHVIHTVGPIYDVHSNPAALLKSSYKNSLSVAKENNIQFIAFPAISCGVFCYPFEEAATVAISTIKEFANDFKEIASIKTTAGFEFWLKYHRPATKGLTMLQCEVHFVLFADDIYSVWFKKAKELLQPQA